MCLVEVQPSKSVEETMTDLNARRPAADPNAKKMENKTLDCARLVLKMVFYALYMALRFVYETAMTFYRTWYKQQELPEGKIRIFSIIFRHKLDMEEISRVQDFWLGPWSVEDAEALWSPNWAPYAIYKDTVYYVLMPKDLKKYSSTTTPFIFTPMFENAMAVAEVPMGTFMKMFGSLEPLNTPKTVLFTNTARCGSTLMARMLDNEGASVCLAEPHVLCHLAIGQQEGYFSTQTLSTLVPAVVNSLRWHVPADEVCVLKTTSGEARLVPFCRSVDKLKHMFMFRRNGFASVEKMVRREGKLLEKLLAMFYYLPKSYPGTLISQEAAFARILQPKDLRMWSAVVYASPYSHYLKNKDLYDADLVWFHDLIGDTDATLGKLFCQLDLPSSCVDQAVHKKETDSQAGSFLSSSLLAHIKIEPLSDEEKQRLRYYAQVMEVPADVFYETQ